MRYIVGVWFLLMLNACGGEATYPTEAQLSQQVARVEGVACNFDIVGTAVFVAPDQVVTNAHVVAGIESPALLLPGGRSVPAELVGFDADRDLALLVVEPTALTNTGFIVRPSTLVDPDEGDVGMIAPVDEDGTLRLLPYEIRREIVATGADIYREGSTLRQALDVAVDINPGDSGAGLFDGNGNLIGIAFASSRQQELVSYAIAASEIRAFIEETDVTTSASSGPCI